MKRKLTGWTLLIAANVALWCVLSFYGSARATPPNPRLPFSNSVQQRNQIIKLLKDNNELLRKQNALLQSGKLRVVAEPAK